MKRILFMAAAALMALTACQEKAPTTATLKVSLSLDGTPLVLHGTYITVSEANASASYEATTDENGVASFTLPTGLYEASTSFKNIADGVVELYNGVNSSISVVAGTDCEAVIELQKSTSSQVLIKEFYGMGVPDAKGTNYANAAYVILYNNSDTEADVSDYGFAFTSPSNAHANNKYRTDGGDPSYWEAGFLPAPWAIWWFTSPVKIAPYSQIVVSIFGAIDHSATVPGSVNLSDPSYYAMYDTEQFNHAAKYPAPADGIPATHYLKTYKYGMGNAWPLSNMDPAFFICKMPGLEAFCKDEANYDLTDGASLPNVKVPAENVVDGMEIYDASNAAKCLKRLPASVDGGYVYIHTKLGYSLYRNVDKEATEALPENEGKLVYDYSLGTFGIASADDMSTTDPSGIDAEASIANGAHIIYKDSNNSTKDFHERQIPSIKK